MGIYRLSGEEITFYVTLDDNDSLPTIRFIQYIGHYSNWIGTEITLVKGIQKYQFDKFNLSSYL